MMCRALKYSLRLYKSWSTVLDVVVINFGCPHDHEGLNECFREKGGMCECLQQMCAIRLKYRVIIRRMHF